jgi:hypothetical protein
MVFDEAGNVTAKLKIHVRIIVQLNDMSFVLE